MVAGSRQKSGILMADRQSESWVFHCGNTLEASGLWDCFHCVPDTAGRLWRKQVWGTAEYSSGILLLRQQKNTSPCSYGMDNIHWIYQRFDEMIKGVVCVAVLGWRKTVMNVQPLFLPTLPSCRTFPPQGRGWHWKDLSLIKKINSSFPKLLHLLVIHLVCCKRKM